MKKDVFGGSDKVEEPVRASGFILLPILPFAVDGKESSSNL